MKQIAVAAMVAFVAGMVPVAAAATGDPLDVVKADLAKLIADASGAEATVAADAKNGDLTGLRRDAKAGLVALKADWKLLRFDSRAAHKSGTDKSELRSLLQAARTQMKEFRSAVRSAFAQAKPAGKQNTGSKGSKGKPSSPGSDEHEAGG